MIINNHQLCTCKWWFSDSQTAIDQKHDTHNFHITCQPNTTLIRWNEFTHSDIQSTEWPNDGHVQTSLTYKWQCFLLFLTYLKKKILYAKDTKDILPSFKGKNWKGSSKFSSILMRKWKKNCPGLYQFSLFFLTAPRQSHTQPMGTNGHCTFNPMHIYSDVKVPLFTETYS